MKSTTKSTSAMPLSSFWRREGNIFYLDLKSQLSANLHRKKVKLINLIKAIHQKRTGACLIKINLKIAHSSKL